MRNVNRKNQNSPGYAKGKAKSLHLSIDLGYLSADQARKIIRMFDTPEAYAENFSALKVITRGLYKVIEDKQLEPESQLGRMFKTVNGLQSALLPDDINEVDRIISNSGLMPM